MPKGCVISGVDITNPDAYAAIRRCRNQSERRPWRRAVGARRAPRSAGGKAPERNVVLEFEGYAVAEIEIALVEGV
jgi:hypothetical protein